MMYCKLLILFLSILGTSECSKLNLPRVLLPIFHSFSTNFTLEVTGIGCYKWSSSRLDIVLVTPIEVNEIKGCSLKAVVSSVSREFSRNMAIVLAEEVITGQVFRADVIVDVISRLNIVTTTRELYMEEPPEMFEVRAYDVEGNEFTTLEGVEFQWSMVGGRTASHVLRFMSFRESTYETPHSIASFDSLGKQGHIVLLEGIRTGVTKVSVQLPHSEYRSVPHVEVSLTVIANLIIDPSDAYILRGDVINFRILQVRQGRLVEIELESSSQYTLIPDDSKIVTVESQKLYGRSLGRTKLSLYDSNAASEQEKLPTAFVTVVEPNYISIVILPYNNWSLFTKQKATLITEVFDSENHKVILGENARIVMSVDESIFLVSERCSNGSVASGAAVAQGVTDVLSTLYPAVGSSQMDKPLLKASATLHVFSPLLLSPSVVAFPYHYSTRSEVVMEVEGGDGVYMWDTMNHSVAIVSQTGILKPSGLGDTEVQVSMVRNQHLKALSLVHVLRPESMEILGGIHETELGSFIYLDIALYGITKDGVKVPFSDCSQMRFSVKVDAAFSHVSTCSREPVSSACAVVCLSALKEAKSKVIVELTTEVAVLDASTMIGSFRPLEPLHPSFGSPVVLSVGSSRNIVVSGGPRPWFGKVLSSYTTDPSIVKAVTLLERQELYVFDVLCTKLGTADFVITAATDPYIPNCDSVKSVTTVPIICAKPKHVELSVSMGPECPLSGSDQALATTNSKFRVNLFVKDSEGRTFDNATSLAFKWSLGKDNLFSVEDPEIINLEAGLHNDFTLPLDHYKEIMTRSLIGSAVIRVRVIGYRTSLLSELLITAPSLDSRAEGTLIVKIVDSVQSDPHSVSVINQASSKTTVSLLYGSSHFGVKSFPEHVTDVTYDSTSRKIIISPITDGQTVLRVEDYCLSATSLNIPVQVVNIGSIRVEVNSRLQKNRQSIAFVRLYDSNDRPLVGDLSGVTLESSSQGIVTLTPDSSNPLKFTVTANVVGRTSLVASWNNLTSPPSPLLVFSAIRISPRNVTLIVGAEYQVEVLGGPGPDLQFTISDSSIASISSAGLLNALHIGETTVHAAALGGSGEIVSKDSVIVTVVPLTGVRISSPTVMLCVGSWAPLWATPIPTTVSPLILGSVNPPLTFAWSLSLPGVAQISDRFSKSHIQVRDEDRLSVEVRGVKAGRTMVNLVVNGHNIAFHTSIEIDIIDELSFTSPPSHAHLLVAPNTRFQLATNLENSRFQVVSVFESGFSGDGENSRAISKPGSVLSISGDEAVSHSVGHAVILSRINHPQSVEQTALIPVQVKRVHYIMMNVVSVLNTTSLLRSLPQGLQLQINVTYHDILGRVFYATPSALHVKISRNDRVHIGHGPVNNSIDVSLESSGSSVLHVLDTISSLSQDYLRIPVESHIQPHKNIMTVGEVICFSIPIGGGEGYWTSDSDVLAIEKQGMARAMKTGSATVTYKLYKDNSKILSTATIEVLPLYGLIFGRGTEVTITNSEIDSDFFIPVYLINERSKREVSHPCTDSPYTPQFFPFHCELRFNSLSVAHSISSVFVVQPTFNKQIGSYGCSVKVMSGPSANISTIQSNVTIRIVESEKGLVDRHHSDSLVLAFHPAIYVTSSQLKLQPPSATAYLVLVTTPQLITQVIVEASDGTVLLIGKRESRSSLTYAWPIQIEQEYWSQYDKQKDLAVHIISHLTNQRIKIPIVTSSLNGQTGCVYIENTDWKLSDITPLTHNSILIAILAVVIFFFASNYCYVQWNRPLGSASPRPISGREYVHTSLQEAALGRRSPPSPYSSQRTVYGSPSSVLDSSSPRIRKLYQ